MSADRWLFGMYNVVSFNLAEIGEEKSIGFTFIMFVNIKYTS